MLKAVAEEAVFDPRFGGLKGALGILESDGLAQFGEGEAANAECDGADDGDDDQG